MNYNTVIQEWWAGLSNERKVYYAIKYKKEVLPSGKHTNLAHFEVVTIFWGELKG